MGSGILAPGGLLPDRGSLTPFRVGEVSALIRAPSLRFLAVIAQSDGESGHSFFCLVRVRLSL
jgi:hypothetical protein